MKQQVILKVPSGQFKEMIIESKRILSYSLTSYFVSNSLSIKLEDILRIVNLIDLKDFENKLLSRDGGQLHFKSSQSKNEVTLENNSNTPTFQRVRNQIPIIGSFNITIHKNIELKIQKDASNLNLLFNDENIKLRFNNPNLENNIRNQSLSKISFQADKVIYYFKNIYSGSDLVIELDLNSTLKEDELSNWSKSFGEKNAQKVKNLACNCCTDSDSSQNNNGEWKRIYLECLEKNCQIESDEFEIFGEQGLKSSIYIRMIQKENYKLNYIKLTSSKNTITFTDFSNQIHYKLLPDKYKISYSATFGEFPDDPVRNHFKLQLEYFKRKI